MTDKDPPKTKSSRVLSKWLQLLGWAWVTLLVGGAVLAIVAILIGLPQSMVSM